MSHISSLYCYSVTWTTLNYSTGCNWDCSTASGVWLQRKELNQIWIFLYKQMTVTFHYMDIKKPLWKYVCRTDKDRFRLRIQTGLHVTLVGLKSWTISIGTLPAWHALNTKETSPVSHHYSITMSVTPSITCLTGEKEKNRMSLTGLYRLKSEWPMTGQENTSLIITCCCFSDCFYYIVKSPVFSTFT